VEIYDSEEAQVDALKRWWKENYLATVVGLLMGGVLILGWNFWQNYKATQSAQAATQYGQILKAILEDNDKSAEKLAMLTQEQYKSTAYSALSALLEAKIKVKQGDLAGAKQILEKTSASADAEISHIAKIRLARLMLASGEYEQGLQLINKIDPATIAGFAPNYDELVGDFYVALDRLDEARTAYQNALRNGGRSPLLQIKLDDLVAPEKVESIK
jgi:predicted negative regulator of RcsB-dependent stress response